MNALDALTSQYKQGRKTSEFGAFLLIGLVQALSAAFDPSKELRDQLSNLTWVAITYIAGRSGLKVARVVSQAKVAAAVATPAGAATQVNGDLAPAAFGGELYGEELPVGESFDEFASDELPPEEYAWDATAVDEGVYESSRSEELRY